MVKPGVSGIPDGVTFLLPLKSGRSGQETAWSDDQKYAISLFL